MIQPLVIKAYRALVLAGASDSMQAQTDAFCAKTRPEAMTTEDKQYDAWCLLISMPLSLVTYSASMVAR